MTDWLGMLAAPRAPRPELKERVLRRAIEVLTASRRRTAEDRRATVRVFKNRLKLLLKRRRKNEQA